MPPPVPGCEYGPEESRTHGASGTDSPTRADRSPTTCDGLVPSTTVRAGFAALQARLLTLQARLAPPPRGAGPRPRYLPRGWVAFLALLFMVASEYSLRRRSQGAALAGDADRTVIIELLAYGVGIAFLLLLLVEPPRRTRLPALLVLLWGYSFSMLLAATWSPFPRLALVRGIQLVTAAGLGHLVARHATPKSLSLLVHSFVALVVASIALGVAVPFPPLPQASGRFTWLYVHPNISGTYVAVGAVVTLALLLRRRAGVPGAHWRVSTYGALLAVQVVALIATRSRGSWAAAAVGLAAVGLAAGRRRSRADVVVVTAAVAGAVWLLAATNIVAFWERGDTQQNLDTLSGRTEVWGAAWELFGEKPLLGHGFMSARGAFLDNFNLGGAHNAFVEVLVNSGLFGIFWWVALVVLCVVEAVRLVRIRHPDGPLLAGILGALLGSTLTAGGLGQAATIQCVWLCLLVGWLVAARRLEWVHPAPPRPAPTRATPLLAGAGRPSPSAGGRPAGPGT